MYKEDIMIYYINFWLLEYMDKDSDISWVKHLILDP